jgi:hypothetical protein
VANQRGIPNSQNKDVSLVENILSDFAQASSDASKTTHNSRPRKLAIGSHIVGGNWENARPDRSPSSAKSTRTAFRTEVNPKVKTSRPDPVDLSIIKRACNAIEASARSVDRCKFVDGQRSGRRR